MRRELNDTWTLESVPADGDPAPAFLPGQFSMLSLPAIGEVPISISGDPQRPGALTYTVRRVGAVTRALCGLKRGALLGARGPFGRPWPIPECAGRDVVLVAGGIGLAPLRPAICSLLRERRKYGRIALLIGARTPADLLFAREVERWRARLDLEVRVTVDSAGSDWRGDVGVVTTLIPRARFEPRRTTALVCGPEVMMRFTADALVHAGLSGSDVHLSLERNMQCAIGWCGHCQIGPFFVCRDGPVFRYDRVESLLRVPEL